MNNGSGLGLGHVVEAAASSSTEADRAEPRVEDPVATRLERMYGLESERRQPGMNDLAAPPVQQGNVADKHGALASTSRLTRIKPLSMADAYLAFRALTAPRSAGPAVLMTRA